MAPKKGGGNKGGNQKSQATIVPDSDYIVFGDGNKKDKKKKAKEPAEEESSGPPKPSARQVIGGASWTGKLPVNLLSEHCQRQKWNKPDYGMRQLPMKDGAEQMYRSDVTISRTDPKTRELTKLPPIRLPPEYVELSDQSSALEARHFAATYALFRICSMKNIHMTLPPNYRDLWKGEFARLKKEDVAAGKVWRYEEDPFAAETKRQDIQRSMEKRKQEQQKKAEADADISGADLIFPLRGAGKSKAWERAPKVDMGQQIRVEIEQVVKQNATWNPYSIKLSQQQRANILTEVIKLGFRRSHVEEALECCKDQEEALEWLMIHVPEDDLPRWALPPSYSAGVSLASGDLAKEARLKRLSRAGYPADECAQALRQCDGVESRAGQMLQSSLVPEIVVHEVTSTTSLDIWSEEMQTLEAISGETFSAINKTECLIKAETSAGLTFSVRFTCPVSEYPKAGIPVISIETEKLPAYIRLSATRQAVLYAYEHLLGEVMVYNICQWLETSLPEIIERPGKLSDISSIPTNTQIYTGSDSKDKSLSKSKSRHNARPRQSNQDTRSAQHIADLWKSRQETSGQIKMTTARQALPAWSKRGDIVSAIENQQVTIISGETGSGKSTQVVQFILDNAIGQLQGPSTNVVCTQPRRVATLSLADRVSSERCSQVGDEVGYIIRGEAKISSKTKITFMTTGVLLRRLQSSGTLSEALANISHIFIDEVHERSLDTDFLLALLRDCMKAQPKLKIVLMSATIDASIFIDYFGGVKKVALVHIEGRTYPVTDLYLDSVLSMTRYNGAGKDEDTARAIQSLGMGINYDLIRDLVECIDNELGSAPGAILVFLPGTLEIERCLRAVGNLPGILGLPLHASLLPAEQRKVFPPAPPGRRKIVAATNVAETSITIEDIVAVIDTGRVKETNYDAANNIVRLEEIWASQAACKQRRGRAGRVRAGICYKLFTKNTESKMPTKNLPEIKRVPLEQLCLSVKATGAERDVATFLSQTLTPPDSSAVSNAIKNLHIMGALEDNRLTALGTYLSLIPADLRCAKLLVYGTLFDCLEPCLTIASILTVKSPFVSPKDKRDESSEARAKFPSSHGDLLLDLAAYDQWSEISYQSRSREIQDWCSSHFLSQQTLRDISSTRRQILDSLKDAGLVPLSYRSSQQSFNTNVNTNKNTSTSDALLLRALIAASLQPQIAEIAFPSKKYISSMSGAKELDPEAKTIKYFIPEESSIQHDTGASTPTSTTSISASTFTLSSSSTTTTPGPSTPTLSVISKSTSTAPKISQSQSHSSPSSILSRIFIHPSSILFTSSTFSHHATHLSYFTKIQTSKPFISNLTPLNIYSLLLFGGSLRVDTSGQGLVVGGVWKVRGWARIGVLVGRLRVLLDGELRGGIEGEESGEEGGDGEGGGGGMRGGGLLGRMKGSRVLGIVRRLVELDGQDQ